jgi:hypothetical protein
MAYPARKVLRMVAVALWPPGKVKKRPAPWTRRAVFPEELAAD